MLQIKKDYLKVSSEKEKADKLLLDTEIVLIVNSIIMLVGFVLVASIFNMEDWLRVVLIVLGVLAFVPTLVFGIKIEQKAGYYVCEKCKHTYVPTTRSVFLAMHFGRTRYMKCPKCKKSSWNKKIVSKE